MTSFDCIAPVRALILFTVVTVAKIAIVPPASGAQSPGPPDIDTLIGLEHPREAVISPDGRYVAYVVETANWEENRYDRYIVLVSTEAGGEPIRLTRGTGSSFRPRFYTDSESIAFLSDRDGAPQIYRLSLTGGDAQKLTSREGGVRAFEFNPVTCEIGTEMFSIPVGVPVGLFFGIEQMNLSSDGSKIYVP